LHSLWKWQSGIP